MAAHPPICDFGWKAPDFNLPATDGKTYNLQSLARENGVLIMYICNHCPYVTSVSDKLARDGKALQELGIGVAAICSNDANVYPEDSFENMVKFASDNRFNFPYLHDESQEIAKAYGAVCTPDFFGFNSNFELQFRGRLDSSGANPSPDNTPRELYEAMKQIAKTGKGPVDQIGSMGCSIKWKSG